MRRAVTAVARGLGVAHRLPAWVSKPAVSADAELASALEALADIEASGRKRQAQAAAAAAPPSPLQATADDLSRQPPPSSRVLLPPDVIADLSKPTEVLAKEASGQRLGELGRMLFAGEGGLTKDIPRATELWKAGAAKKDMFSMHQVVLALVDGLGTIPRNRALAEQGLAELANNGGSGLAAFGLGALLLRTELEGAGALSNATMPDVTGIPAEKRMSPGCVRAFQALGMAAKAGVPPALLNLAHCYFHGIGTKADAALGMQWLRAAVDKGDMLAVVELAGRLAKEAGGPGTSVAAKASETAGGTKGVPAAPTSTGSSIAGSGSSPLDRLRRAQARWESLRLWRRAAEAGHPLAMHNLGAALMEGWGPYMDAAMPHTKGKALVIPEKGEADPAAALIWFRRAASAGFHRSMLNTAMMMERGYTGEAGVVLRDLPAALEWYRKALEVVDRAVQVAQAKVEAADDGEASSAAAARLASARRMQESLAARVLKLRARIAAEEKATAAGGAGQQGGTTAEAEAGAAADEADGAELRLDFSSAVERDEAMKALRAMPGAAETGDGSVGALTAGGLLRYLSTVHSKGAGAASSGSGGGGSGAGAPPAEPAVKVTVLKPQQHKSKDKA